MYIFNGSTVLTDDPEAAKYWLQAGRDVTGFAEDEERKKAFKQIMGDDFQVITTDELSTFLPWVKSIEVPWQVKLWRRPQHHNGAG